MQDRCPACSSEYILELRHAFVDQNVCVADARSKRKGKNAQCADREHAENGTHDIEHGTAHGRDGAELFPCRANL